MSREMTEAEVRDKLLEYIWSMIDYWHKESRVDFRGKLEGLAYSILAALDGESDAVPQFIVAPLPHKDDRRYHEARGENYFPKHGDTEVDCNLGGSLHGAFYPRGQELGMLNDLCAKSSIKPCPFCGSSVDLKFKNGVWGGTPGKVSIRCDHCGIGFTEVAEEWEPGIGTYSIQEQAEAKVLKRWNTRKAYP